MSLTFTSGIGLLMTLCHNVHNNQDYLHCERSLGMNANIKNLGKGSFLWLLWKMCDSCKDNYYSEGVIAPIGSFI